MTAWFLRHERCCLYSQILEGNHDKGCCNRKIQWRFLKNNCYFLVYPVKIEFFDEGILTLFLKANKKAKQTLTNVCLCSNITNCMCFLSSNLNQFSFRRLKMVAYCVVLHLVENGLKGTSVSPPQKHSFMSYQYKKGSEKWAGRMLFYTACVHHLWLIWIKEVTHARF